MLLYHRFYGIWPTKVIILSFLALVVWLGLAIALGRWKRGWRCACAAILVAMLYFIIDMTILKRSPGDHELILQPFRNLILAFSDSELYRSIVMNTVLFMPIGMTMPFLLPKSWKRWLRVIVCVVFSVLLSGSIEFFQYRYGLGQAEIDDLICNTLGAFLGAIPFMILETTAKWWHFILMKYRTKKEQDTKRPK